MSIEITYELTIEPEDMSPSEQALEWVNEQLEAGNEWAWFCAKVTARVEIGGETFEGHDYLGGCSYESRAAFEINEPGHYYHDMRHAALLDLRDNIRAAQDRGTLANVAATLVQEELNKS